MGCAVGNGVLDVLAEFSNRCLQRGEEPADWLEEFARRGEVVGCGCRLYIVELERTAAICLSCGG